jgi:hypothetical protein
MRSQWQIKSLLRLAPAILCVGCAADAGSSPKIKPLSDRVTYVGQELTLEISATDDDGDALEFNYWSCQVTTEGCKKQSIKDRADLRQAGNLAVFRWTPITSDAGTHSIDFTVSDGKNVSKETISIEVKVDQGSTTAPIFRKPIGAGTALDLSVKSCIDNLPVLVEDQDSVGVTITQDAPVLEGAQFDLEDPFSGSWRWCPTEAQIQAAPSHTLRLTADDGDNPPVFKAFVIMLLKAPDQGCPGEAPVIEPMSETEISELVGLTIEARVKDDVGVKNKLLLYYTFERPSEPLDLAALTQVEMALASGDPKDGVWTAAVPNPVASKPEGSTASVYYVVIAQDGDDPEGDCEHVTKSPQTGAREIRVTNPGGAGGLGLCVPCTADVQCGGSEDLCARLGAAGDSFCFRACTGDQDCAAPNYVCGPPITSVNGVSARQCLPSSGQCGSTGGACASDAHEPDDAASQARAVSLSASAPYRSTGNSICAWNEDWFGMNLQQGQTLYVSLGFQQASSKQDLDIILYKQGKNLTPCDETTEVGCDQQNGQSWDANEQLVWPNVETATYYVVVRGFNGSENEYDICISLDASQCSAD